VNAAEFAKAMIDLAEASSSLLEYANMQPRMTQPQQARGDDKKPEQTDSKKVTAYINRLMLRIFNVPSFQSFLADTACIPDKDEPGAMTLQLDFQRLPEEAIPHLVKLLASPSKIHIFNYTKDDAARTGVQIKLSPDMFAGDETDYAF
jgi:hypothetical protein